jgi:anti-anti-sigma regulatory factor
MGFRTFEVELHGRKAVVVLSVTDASSVRDELYSLLCQGPRVLVLDCGAVVEVDSYLVGAFIDIQSWLRKHSGELQFCGIHKDVTPWLTRALEGSMVYATRVEALSEEGS